ncbi:polycomb complex protein BMI-1-like [Argonauta hians]
MYRSGRLKISEINPHLTCILCGGYYIDATTIIECLHSFCKTCIVRYLESSKYCPICDVLVHKTRPLQHIRQDQILQNLVYKMVPGLFSNEMKKRRDYYIKHPCSANHQPCGSVDSEMNGLHKPGEGARAYERIIYSEDEKISLSLEFSSNGCPPDCCHHQEESDRLKLNLLRVAGKYRVKKKKISSLVSDCRYLLCPASVTVAHLKKFIRMKFSLSPRYKIDIFHTDESLTDSYTLIDIAYIYTWRRRGPLRLFYSVYENPAKRIKFSEPRELDINNPTSTSTNNHYVATSIPHLTQNGDKSDSEIIKESARSGGSISSCGGGVSSNCSSNNKSKNTKSISSFTNKNGSSIFSKNNGNGNHTSKNSLHNSSIASVIISSATNSTTTTAAVAAAAAAAATSSRETMSSGTIGLSINNITSSSVPSNVLNSTATIMTSPSCTKVASTSTGSTTASTLEVKNSQLTSAAAAAAIVDNQNITFKMPEDEKFERPKDFKELVFNGQVLNGHDENVIVKTEPMTDALSVMS